MSTCVKVIKLYAWEIPFKKLIDAIRLEELDVLKKTSILGAVMVFSWTCAPFIVSTNYSIIIIFTVFIVWKE